VLNSQASEAAKNLQDAQEQLKDAEARCKKLTEENEMLLHSLHESMAVLEEMRGQAHDKVEVQMLYDAVKALGCSALSSLASFTFVSFA
jgi:chromosome segregation ATPase